MASSRSAKWIFRAIQLLSAFTVFDGAFRLATLVQAHTCGLNRFDPNDGALAMVAGLELAAGAGTLRCKNWGRALLLACVAGRLAFVAYQFFLVLRVGIGEVDALGWVLMTVILGFFGALIALLVRGWRSVKDSGYLVSSAGRAIAMWTSLFIGVAFSLLQRVSFEEAAAGDRDLDVEFLKQANQGHQWQLYRARTDGTPSSILVGSLRVSEREGQLILAPLPPGSRCGTVLDATRGTLSIQGNVFTGTVFAGAPRLIGGRPIKGLQFSKEDGPVCGNVTLAADMRGNLFVFLEQFSVYGKAYEGIFVAPRSEPRSRQESKTEAAGN